MAQAMKTVDVLIAVLNEVAKHPGDIHRYIVSKRNS